ncbi:TetR/AcrR family transcriptional regulator [Granulicoccus phenolivorans]|uniref:TetR/AcrR family transcriptional regulator n=1 Tax=Granulicoccus phenolivorans TaxID=266854 RepID=UPI000419D7FF|nr:TetR/AcrR family transcriptional regulator [Granulicoccus phenolivorans]
MRSSKRDHILDSALRVVEEQGVTALTFESVAAAAGLTKGGLLYHFPTKEAMLRGLHEHVAQRWDAELCEALGGDPEQATPEELVAAYARVSVRGATGPELLLMLEARTDPELSRIWSTAMARWTPDPATLSPDDPDTLRRLVAYFAADGLWLSDSLGSFALPAGMRRAVAEQIVNSVRDQPSD